MTPKRLIQVLLIEDDREFAQMVVEYLHAEGDLRLQTRHDGQTGIAAAQEFDFDIILLDVGLPKLNGFEVLKAIRTHKNTPVIMLTARGDDIDRILGLEIGADDYVAKPCNLRELTARIRAIMRRLGNRHDPKEQGTVHLGDIRLESSSQSAYLNDHLVPLTSAEFLVLEALTTTPGQVVEKEAITRHALGRRMTPFDRSVDVHIGHLRKKLGPLADGRQRIKTVRGRGYLWIVAS